MASRHTSQLRIIGGRWRRHSLEWLNHPAIRPTPNRIRETLFNWLAPHIEEARCLDLFAGSGVLGFEAVSRGAAAATLVESNRLICATIANQITRFQADTIRLVSCDAYTFIRRARDTYDIVFLDPPFAGRQIHKALSAIVENKSILTPTSLVYVECSAQTAIAPSADWEVLRHARAAGVRYALLGRGRCS